MVDTIHSNGDDWGMVYYCYTNITMIYWQCLPQDLCRWHINITMILFMYHDILIGGLEHDSSFSIQLGIIIPLTNIFQRDWNHQPVYMYICFMYTHPYPYGSKYLLRKFDWGVIHYHLEHSVPSQTVFGSIRYGNWYVTLGVTYCISIHDMCVHK